MSVGYDEYTMVVQLTALKSTEVSPLQPLKAPIPMLVTELGMVTEVSPLQNRNALVSIIVTELGMMIEGKAVQASKAS